MRDARRQRGGGSEPLGDDDFVARAGRNTVRLIVVLALFLVVATGLIGVYGAWRVENAPERSDDGGVECGEDLENRTLRQLQVCPRLPMRASGRPYDERPTLLERWMPTASS